MEKHEMLCTHSRISRFFKTSWDTTNRKQPAIIYFWRWIQLLLCQLHVLRQLQAMNFQTMSEQPWRHTHNWSSFCSKHYFSMWYVCFGCLLRLFSVWTVDLRKLCAFCWPCLPACVQQPAPQPSDDPALNALDLEEAIRSLDSVTADLVTQTPEEEVAAAVAAERAAEEKKEQEEIEMRRSSRSHKASTG